MSDMGLPKRSEFLPPVDQKRLVADDEGPDNSIAKYVDGSLTKPKAPTQVGGKKRTKRKRRLEHPDVFIVAQLQSYLLQQQGREERDASVQPPG